MYGRARLFAGREPTLDNIRLTESLYRPRDTRAEALKGQAVFYNPDLTETPQVKYAMGKALAKSDLVKIDQPVTRTEVQNEKLLNMLKTTGEQTAQTLKPLMKSSDIVIYREAQVLQDVNSLDAQARRVEAAMEEERKTWSKINFDYFMRMYNSFADAAPTDTLKAEIKKRMEKFADRKRVLTRNAINGIHTDLDVKYVTDKSPLPLIKAAMQGEVPQKDPIEEEYEKSGLTWDEFLAGHEARAERQLKKEKKQKQNMESEIRSEMIDMIHRLLAKRSKSEAPQQQEIDRQIQKLVADGKAVGVDISYDLQAIYDSAHEKGFETYRAEELSKRQRDLEDEFRRLTKETAEQGHDWRDYLALARREQVGLEEPGREYDPERPEEEEAGPSILKGTPPPSSRTRSKKEKPPKKREVKESKKGKKKKEAEEEEEVEEDDDEVEGEGLGKIDNPRLMLKKLVISRKSGNTSPALLKKIKALATKLDKEGLLTPGEINYIKQVIQ